jgi:hypothetical protein
MQTRTLVAVFVLMVSPPASGFQTKREWVTYTSVAGRYSISMPRQPKLSTQQITTRDGKKFTQYLAESLDGDGVLVVGHFDYPSITQLSFADLRETVLKNMHATLLGEDSITLGSWPGRQMRILMRELGVELIMRARIYDSGTRMYILECVYPKAEDGLAVAEKCGKFFDSFKVTSLASNQTTHEWVTYNSAEGRYSISMPGQPTLSSVDIPNKKGEKVMEHLAMSLDGDGILYIMHFDHPAGKIYSFDDARDRMLRGVQGTLLGEDSITLGSWPGRELRLLTKKSGQELIVRLRMYDAGTRIYMLECGFPRAKDDRPFDEKCAKFFDSFKRTDAR